MISHTGATGSAATEGTTAETSRLYLEGIIAGTIGAATIAVWFLVLDVVQGRPLYTPTVLGTALFRGLAGLDSLKSAPFAFEMVLMYTWVHWLAFCVIGGLAARLLRAAERNPNLGFGMLLLFVVFEFGFLVVGMIFAEPILHALTWPAILLGNLLAAAGMGGYFWLRHPHLTIWP